MRTFLIILTITTFYINTFSQNGWVQVTSNTTRSIGNPFFINQNTGWLFASNGEYVKTTDKGVSWVRYSFNASHPLRDFFFINENTGWAVGGTINFAFLDSSRMVIYKTVNGGTNWNLILSDNDLYHELTCVHFFDESTGIVFGDGGNESVASGVIRKTTNGGNTWSYLPSYSVNFIQSDINGNLWKLGYYGDDVGRDTTYVHFSGDRGNSWNVKGVFHKVGFVRDFKVMPERIIISARNDTISFRSIRLTSLNQGINWSMTVLDSGFHPSYYTFINMNTGWTTSLSSIIYKTTNNCASWVPQLNFAGSVYMFDSLTGIAFGSGGKIYRTQTGGVLNVQQTTPQTPENYLLSQNYPNPFNPLTRINYELPITNYISIKVYDALGNEVQTLVNEKQNAGSYSVDFNAASLPSGIYFYKLVTEKFSETRKMILIK